MDRKQKSDLWIWSTLWLTTFIDAFLMCVLVVIVLSFLGVALAPFVMQIIISILYGLGALLASRYVVRRSIVSKRKATKYAMLAPIIPTVVSFMIAFFAIQNVLAYGGELSVAGLSVYGFNVILTYVIIFVVVRLYITSYGDDAVTSSI